MSHPLTGVILATGGKDMVKAAYSSGKPAFGVGPGNVPVYVHPSADAEAAVRHIVRSKTFDFKTSTGFRAGAHCRAREQAPDRQRIEAAGHLFP